ncbi:uncharacterized protein LOC133316601 [Gastrolobium bilobum]|uniref:uncharacterized protein LOC133316601 n=1 Tax=Gastrolobium bilobum TaxID=150636 RepID=UPI002AB15A88|nr:uncharacterized protein LOC133316601 [Gastrolobium bilobum]
MSSKDSLGKDDRRNTSIHADFDYIDTQPFETSSPSCGDHGDNEWRYLEDTVPIDDDDDALETQAVNLAGETQVMEIAGETQSLDDTDSNTQLLDEGSESDRTRVLENDEDDDDDPQCRGESKEVLGESSCGHGDKTGPVINSSGSMPPRFTSIRAEFLREASFAARNMALKQSQDKTNSVMGMSQFCQEPVAVKDNGESFPRCSEEVREVDQEYDNGKYSVETEGFKNKNIFKVASSAVRKLFSDDLPVETNGQSHSSNDLNEEDDLDKLPIYHGELAGLSYANSQEPGEFSQANALDVVDRFLKDNIIEFDQETNCVKNREENLKSLPSTKGQQSLAKIVNDRDKARKIGIYDWDDSREDEGGGDIFKRRREDFFEGGTQRPRSLPGFQKIKVRKSNVVKDDEELLSVPNKRKTAVHSDSRLGMHNLKVRDNTIQEATRKLKRNLANELDDQFDNTNCPRGEMEPNAHADVQEIMDVGFDTQMAAEAMEALCHAENIVDHVANNATHVAGSSLSDQLNNFSTGRVGPDTSKECSGQYDKKRKVNVKSDLQTSGLSKKCAKEVRQCKKDNMMIRSKRRKLNARSNQTSSANENGRIVSSPLIEQRKLAGALKRRQHHELNNPESHDRGSGRSIVKERQLQGEVCHFTPIARRTRQSSAVKQLINPDTPSNSLREGDIGIGTLEKSSGVGLHSSKALNPKYTPGSSDHFKVDDSTKLCQPEKLAPKAGAVSVSNDVEMDKLVCRRRRSLRIRKLSNHDKGSEKLVGSSKPSAESEEIGKSTAGKRQMRRDKINKGEIPICCDVINEKDANLNSDKKNNAHVRWSTNNFEVTSSDESPRERYNSSDLASAAPANCKMPMNDASPVCMGDGYNKHSYNRELRRLSASRPELITPSKDSRRRKDMTDVRILYSHHLDEDVIKRQKKILARLGVSVASSIADATHFIADQFVRTRNMLEAIAFAKPVVTHLWIESCGQASCFIDERNYILRDAKKEKEFGFSMPVSLARASQHPLLEGRRVLITPNAKPSKEIISSLVIAVRGQAVDRVGRSALKDHKIPDDLLIVSCEEDYASCVPFLEKGAMVYSSELLLNGIVTQKLEYQRYSLFADNVKKTRSTVWLKRDDITFIPVNKCK